MPAVRPSERGDQQLSAETISLVPVPDEEPDGADERFQVLFRRYYGRVKGLAARRFPTFDSDDVAQETMVRVLLHAHRLDPQRDPWPYIAAITVNVGRDLARAQLPEAPLNEDSWDREVAPAADEPVLAADRCATVQNVLATLAPASRQVLALQAYDEMTVGEIARFLGTNDNAVRQKLFRARRQFRRAFAGVPSGAFGIVAVLRRARRRVSAANLAQGGGLSFSSAAALAVAVAGAVTYTVAPGGANGDATAAPAPAILVQPVRAFDGGSPETPDKARTAPTGATTVAARPGTPGGNGTIALPADPPVGTVRVGKPGAGNLVDDDGGEVSHAEIVVPTPAGDVTVRNALDAYAGHTWCQVIDSRMRC